tara:strand:- start:1397 stop:2296 length:900 start_codon:yes stop_codon:yes gene_type:complete
MLYNLVNFIVATDKKLGIGKDNNIPWYISEELKYFKNLTNSNIVIMGSKTFFSIPSQFRPLKNRLNLVLTNNKELLKNNHTYTNLKFFNFKTDNKTYLKISNNDDFFKLTTIYNLVNSNPVYKNKEIFIIGGQKIYELFFELFEKTTYFELQFNKIYLTYLDKDYKCDTFFPKLSSDFKLINYSEKHYNKDENVFFRYCIFQKDILSSVNIDKKYLDIANNILNNGNYRIDRTGTGIFSIFGTHTRYDISKYIPILTTKRVPFQTCVNELLWFLQGDTNNKNLQKKKYVYGMVIVHVIF